MIATLGAGGVFVLLANVCERVIQDGALTLIDADGRTHRFGRASRAADIVVRLHDRSLHRRLFISPRRAIDDGYASGSLTLERGSIYDLLDLLAQAGAAFESRPASRIRRAIEWPTSLFAPASRDDDEPPESAGDQILDWDRQSSCAYFSDPRMTLEEAQHAKKHHIASKLLLRPGHRVLDVGSGSGGLAMHLADAEHVEVTGLTRSPRDLAVSRRRAFEAELGSRVSFHLRELADERGTYDRVVSVGPFEGQRARDAGSFFQKIHDVLRDDGVALVHAIGRVDGPSRASAEAPSLSELFPAIERSRLWVTDVEILRLHHAETLRHWRRRLLDRWDRLATRYGEARCRRWEARLAASEVSFRRGGLVVFQLQLARRIDAVPITRDYLYERTQGSELDVDEAA